MGVMAGMTATDKQVAFALSLLAKAGYGDRYMTARFANLGATMHQRSGTVEGWLRQMTRTEISSLITMLKESED